MNKLWWSTVNRGLYLSCPFFSDRYVSPGIDTSFDCVLWQLMYKKKKGSVIKREGRLVTRQMQMVLNYPFRSLWLILHSFTDK